jgi:hypothetical protein
LLTKGKIMSFNTLTLSAPVGHICNISGWMEGLWEHEEILCMLHVEAKCKGWVA